MTSRNAFRLGLAVAALIAIPAFAADSAAFKARKAEFEKLARKHDDEGSRNVRDAVYDLVDFLGEKGCRKLLKKTYDKDKSLRVKTAVVEVLASCGDPKEVASLVTLLNKETNKKNAPQAPAIALAAGLALTPGSESDAIAGTLLGAFKKAKGNVRLSLWEALGRLRAPTSSATILTLPVPDMVEERFERNIAVGACGGEAAVPVLSKELPHPDPRVRLGAAIGLTHCSAPEAMTALLALAEDPDPVVVEVVAEHMAATKHEAAVAPLVEAFPTLPLRSQCVVAAALEEITGAALGHDVDAWKRLIAAKKDGTVPPKKGSSPTLPEFFGMPIPSSRVVVLIDQSGSMDWMKRFPRAKEGVAAYLEALPQDSEFSVYGVSRILDRFAERPTAGARKLDAADWVRELRTDRGFYLAEAFDAAMAENPDADTILIATDSRMTAKRANIEYVDTPPETLWTFRRGNRTRRVRIFVAFVVPGGRDKKQEVQEGEYDDRIERMRQLAESTGGQFALIDQ